jgi:hypothetical protein
VTLSAPVETVSAETVPRVVRWPGRAALAAGILTVVAVVVGLTAVTLDEFAVATIAAWTAIGLSAVAVVGGVVAAIGNWDRGAAIAAIIVGALANPLVLLYGLGAMAGLDAVASA